MLLCHVASANLVCKPLLRGEAYNSRAEVACTTTMKTLHFERM